MTKTELLELSSQICETVNNIAIKYKLPVEEYNIYDELCKNNVVHNICNITTVRTIIDLTKLCVEVRFTKGKSVNKKDIEDIIKADLL